MKIDKTNYEAYMLDFLEGTISSEDRELLFSFLDRHPELKDDLDVPVDLVLPGALEKSVLDKTKLKKHPSAEFDLSPGDYLYIKAIEEGLTPEEHQEQILLEPNEEKRNQEIRLFSKSILKSDLSIHLPAKAKLKRVVLIQLLSHYRMQQVAAVIAVLLLATALWLVPGNLTQNSTTRLADAEKQNITNEIVAETQPKIVEKKVILQKPPTKDSLMKIAKDPLGRGKAKKAPEKIVESIEMIEPHQLLTLSTIKLDPVEPVNAFEQGLNVMMPQYMSNNILRRELAEIYDRIEEESTPPKNLALVESGVKVLNFFSKDAVSLDKYYDEQGNVVGYNLEGNGLNVQRRAK